jgi:ubiquinone biosynthesis protein
MAQARTSDHNLGRVSEIAQVAVKHGFGYFFKRNKLQDLVPSNGEVDPAVAREAVLPSARGRHLREMLDELGPTFVKFGQLLSMRPDIVPPDIIVELRALQDDVRPFPFEQARAAVETQLGQPLERLFLSFDDTPMAAASIGQVHRAVLPNGQTVVVKVQRPDAPRQIEADLALMYRAARIAKDRVRALDFIDVEDLVDEFARSIRQELDYRQEARNADRFRHGFAGRPRIHVPKVYWTYTRAQVLTLEYIEGIQIADIEAAGFTLEERRDIAYLMTDAWMTMIFKNGFFHGDPHPANVLVLPSRNEIGLVDFGLAGQLTDEDMSKLTRLFVDAVNENIEAIPRHLASLGVHYPKEKEEQFVAELREVFYRYYGASLNEIDPVKIIREAFALIYDINLQLPTRFLLLDRAIATLGSVGIELYPDFNVFEVARPYARDLLLGRYTPRRILTRTAREAVNLGSIASEVPYQVHDFLEQARDGQIEVGFVHKGIDDFLKKMDVVINRLVVAFVLLAVSVVSAITAVFANHGTHLLGLHVIGVIGIGVSCVLGIWLLWSVVRSGRL